MVPPEQDSIICAGVRETGETTGQRKGPSSGSRHFVYVSRLIAVSVVVLLAAMSAGCNKSKKTESISSNFDPEVTPTMITRPVTTLISDSGITRYRITAPVWYVYDEASEPRWNFPEGMNMEKFDNFFRQEATVRCDSATYLTRKQLWKLDGYVHIENVAGEQFLTQQLFWNQRTHKIYSDSFIHILRADRVIEGYGFESDEQMEHYRVRQVQGIFPVSQFQGGDNQAGGTGKPSGNITVGPDPAASPDSASAPLPAMADSTAKDTEDPVDTHRPTRPRHKRVLRPSGGEGIKKTSLQ